MALPAIRTRIRYKTAWKRQWLDRFQGWLAEAMPYCEVRYAF